MARNRKNQSAAVRFAPALKALMLCLFIGGSGVGYVWYKNQVALLGWQIKEREIQLTKLRKQNCQSRVQFDALCSPLRLEQQIKKLNLGLMAPPVSQIVRLVEKPVENLSSEPRSEPADSRQAQADPRIRGN
jgi:hypothetical protein